MPSRNKQRRILVPSGESIRVSFAILLVAGCGAVALAFPHAAPANSSGPESPIAIIAQSPGMRNLPVASIGVWRARHLANSRHFDSSKVAQVRRVAAYVEAATHGLETRIAPIIRALILESWLADLGKRNILCHRRANPFAASRVSSCRRAIGATE
jgi:hypothetical protein